MHLSVWGAPRPQSGRAARASRSSPYAAGWAPEGARRPAEVRDHAGPPFVTPPRL